MGRMNKSGLIIAIILLCAGLLVAAPQDIRKSFKVDYDGLLTLDTDIGAISVNTISGKTVEVEVRFKPRSGGTSRVKRFLEEFDLDFKQSGNNVTVIGEYRRDWNFWDSIGRYVKVEFFVTVPEKYNVDLKTSGGSISVDDLEGRVDAKTSGGSLKFGNIDGPVSGRTSGGSITLDGCNGDANVNTSGGAISIGRVNGNVEAHTSGGSINVEEAIGYVDASTSGGSVTARISKQPERDCRLRTSGGSVTVYMERDVKVNLDASTSGGRVHTEFPVMVRGEISKRKLRAEVNGGGPEVYLRTSGGSIYIKEI
jgi:DUF4097 and DUF4098 domain-containing protein YvlB